MTSSVYLNAPNLVFFDCCLSDGVLHAFSKGLGAGKRGLVVHLFSSSAIETLAA